MRKRNGIDQAATAREAAPARPPRCRLPADVRINQILDAALAEFSTSGFAGARIDDIAARAGMSKGGVYTHFGSKDEIFAALLERSLMPPLPATSKASKASKTVRLARRAMGARKHDMANAQRAAYAQELMTASSEADAHGAPGASRPPAASNSPPASSAPAGPASLAAIVDLLAGDLYAWSTSEPVIATLRLLIAESRRAPHAVERWQKQVERAVATAVGRLVRRGVEAGELRDGVAARTPLLLVAPLTHACLRQALRAAPATRRQVAAARRDYARFIEELLT